MRSRFQLVDSFLLSTRKHYRRNKEQDMDKEFINITEKNLDEEHLCCIIRAKKHEGIKTKKAWLKDRLKEGHVFRKLNVKGTVFIEYVPLETAWVPVVGDNYIYIYCLWVLDEFRKHGYARSLMEYCIADAKAKGKSGICMLGAKKQKHWLSDQSFAKKFGFETVDSTDNGYELLALSFDGSMPRFTDKARECRIEDKNLTFYYDMQCPYIFLNIRKLKEYCNSNSIMANFNEVTSLEQAKNLPCVFNNWGVFYNGEFKTVNLVFPSEIQKIIKN